VSPRRRRRAAAWIRAFLVLTGAPLVVLLVGDDVPPPVGIRWDLLMGPGFAGLSLMGAQFALTARVRRASGPFGIDVIYVLHRHLAWIALEFVEAHLAPARARRGGARDEISAKAVAHLF
jgi:predicted ferric reductase